MSMMHGIGPMKHRKSGISIEIENKQCSNSQTGGSGFVAIQVVGVLDHSVRPGTLRHEPILDPEE